MEEDGEGPASPPASPSGSQHFGPLTPPLPFCESPCVVASPAVPTAVAMLGEGEGRAFARLSHGFRSADQGYASSNQGDDSADSGEGAAMELGGGVVGVAGLEQGAHAEEAQSQEAAAWLTLPAGLGHLEKFLEGGQFAAPGAACACCWEWRARRGTSG
jgi:hypothetical protein